MDKPLVSICCETYNHEPYVRDALEGFLIQKTDFSFEILVHDDASTDNTANIIREYSAKYPDIIKPIYQTVNQYSQEKSIWREFQYPRAQGKYIAHCEGDDYWIDPLKLQKQVDYLEQHPECGMAYSDIYYLYSDSPELVDVHLKIKSGRQFSNLLNGQVNFSTATICVRRDLLTSMPQLDPRYYFLGDLMIFLLVAQAAEVYGFKEKMSVYRYLTNSASHIPDPVKAQTFNYQCYNTREYFLERSTEEIENKRKLFLECKKAQIKYCLFTDHFDDVKRIKLKVSDLFVTLKGFGLVAVCYLCRNPFFYRVIRPFFSYVWKLKNSLNQSR